MLDTSTEELNSRQTENESRIADNTSIEVIEIPDSDSKKQMSRIESKVEQIYSEIQQMKRMVISLKMGCGGEPQRTNESIILPELPLQTALSLKTFEEELSDPSYRKKIVSLNCISKLFWPDN